MDHELKILLLEDNEDDAEIILELLKKNALQFKSKVVMDRDNFLLELEQFKPDLVLSDNSLPQFSATQALEILARQPHYTPFILITGTVSDEFAANIMKRGAADYILKDRLTRLPSAIDAALQKQRTAMAIRQKEEDIRFQANLLAIVGQAIIATDLNGTITYWNQRAESTYGWLAEEAIGQNINALTPTLLTAEQLDRMMKDLEQGSTWSGEYEVQRKDGTMVPVFATDSPIIDQEGNMTGVIGASIDITERKKAERELRALEEQILQQKIEEQKKISRAIIKAQEEQSNHIGQELHDNISQILAGTKLFLSTAALKNESIRELIRYPLQLIDNSIEEIRMLSSMQVTPLKNVDLKELVEILVNNLDKTTSIKTVFDYRITGTKLDDEFKLNIYRVIQEQVNNILKHADAKNVHIIIDDQDGVISIEVRDDGKGFDLNKRRKGIGISNLINRIESFNGEVTIQSEIGKGSRISVRIPH
jgi:two-component system sensor histidine kinase UhpB